MSTERSFVNRRLHSLLGVIPVGFFLVEHLYTNFAMTRGIHEFIEQVEWIWSLPFLPLLEVVFIYIPLLYHGIYGVYIAFQAKNNVSQYGTFRNIMFMLQRVTGIITLVYVVWHVWQTRVQLFIYDFTSAELADHTAQILQNPVTLTLYIIGLLAAVFHFSNGMWSFLVSWGITVGPRAQMISTWVWGVVFLILSYMGITSLLAFAQHSI
jgi:succinate dehydrogenase / fumarate reductase cytochrome b subunit